MKFPVGPRQKPWAALMWMDRSGQRFGLHQRARAGACGFSAPSTGTCHFRFKPRREGDPRYSGRLSHLAAGAHLGEMGTVTPIWTLDVVGVWEMGPMVMRQRGSVVAKCFPEA